MLDTSFKVLVILLLVGNRLYWEVQARIARSYLRERSLPSDTWRRIIKLVHPLFEILIPLQLLGVSLFTIDSKGYTLQIIGTSLVLIGITIGILGRREMKHNWTADQNFQIKQSQSLVTTGIYHYIRHPIYLGRIITFCGAELVARSYLIALVFITYVIIAIIQSQKEEETLQKAFGVKYINYQRHTKKFIPGIY